MRRGSMEGENSKQTQLAEDLDDIATLMNLLELQSRLRIAASSFDTQLD